MHLLSRRSFHQFLKGYTFKPYDIERLLADSRDLFWLNNIYLIWEFFIEHLNNQNFKVNLSVINIYNNKQDQKVYTIQKYILYFFVFR